MLLRMPTISLTNQCIILRESFNITWKYIFVMIILLKFFSTDILKYISLTSNIHSRNNQSWKIWLESSSKRVLPLQNSLNDGLQQSLGAFLCKKADCKKKGISVQPFYTYLFFFFLTMCNNTIVRTWNRQYPGTSEGSQETVHDFRET